MPLQKNLTPGTGTATFARIPNGESAREGTTPLQEKGHVDNNLGMVVLARGIPLAVTPSVEASIVQNTMPGRDQLLYVSEHGQMDGAWLSVPGMSCIEFAKQIYLMQISYDVYAFPLANK